MCILFSPSGECYLAVEGKEPPVGINHHHHFIVINDLTERKTIHVEKKEKKLLVTENSICTSYLSVQAKNSVQ